VGFNDIPRDGTILVVCGGTETSILMIRNYWTSILRYIFHNKLFTFINIMGLAIGMMVCLLITQFVLHELSYDNFHANGDRIFRLQQDRYEKGQISTRWASGAVGIGPDMKAEFPEVEAIVRMTGGDGVLAYGETAFSEENLWFASEEFFSMFSIPLLSGNDSLVLKDPFTIVLSQSTAKKYFGAEDPVGKTVKLNGREEYHVTGVFADLPANTHMKFDALMSFATKLRDDPLTTWNWDGFMTYIMLDKKSDVEQLKAKFPEFVKKKTGQEEGKPASLVINLQRLGDIHLDSDFMGEFKPNGNRKSVHFLSVIAILVLVIAWINYINLASAKSVERAREVGVRKVMGGLRQQLIQQFMLESLLLNLFSVLLAIAIAGVLLDPFGEVMGREFNFVIFQSPYFWLATFSIVIIGAVLAGIYPAFILSSYKPVEVLRGRFKNSSRGVLFRKFMVTGQFVASITLIVGTFAVYTQMTFMENQKLGVTIDQTLIVPSPRVADSTYEQKYEVFKERLKQYPEVVSIAASTEVPGRQPGWNAGGIRRLSQPESEANQYRVIMMDEGFIPSYQLEVSAGRPFSSKNAAEEKTVLLNESAVDLMGFERVEDALDDQIYFWGDTFRIVGVVKNYHQESLKKAYEPLIFRYNNAPGGKYSIKFNVANIQQSMAKFESAWKEIFPGNPFNYFFLDDHFAEQYKADQQFGKIFGVASVLAIFIACLGLLGLASLTVLQRTKEIGIRKVLGASLPGILSLMSREYLLLLIISVIVSVPLSWLIMQNWLNDFANRITLTWWIFLIPSIFVMSIALFTVAGLTLKTALTNPAKSLRYE
jgi:putative ABC transport system permease protein